MTTVSFRFGCGNSTLGLKKKKDKQSPELPPQFYHEDLFLFLVWPCVILLIQMQWCIVLAACHTQKSTPGHPVRGKRPMWPVSQQLDWHTQVPRTAIIISACVYLEIIHCAYARECTWMSFVLYMLWATGDTYILTVIFQMDYIRFLFLVWCFQSEAIHLLLHFLSPVVV